MDGRIANENNNEDEVFLNNNLVGENLTFCGHQRWRATMKTSCNERVQYITKRYGRSDQEARISIMKNKDCICDSRYFGGGIGPDKKGGYIGSKNTTSLSLPGFIIASLMMLMVWIFSSSGRQHLSQRISYRTVRLFMYFILVFLTPIYIISMFELANNADTSPKADWIVFRTLPKKSIMTPVTVKPQSYDYDRDIDYSLIEIESRLDQALYGSKEWELTHRNDTEDGRPLPHFFMHIPKTGGYYAYTWLNRMLFQKGSPIFQLPIEDKFRLCNIGTERLQKRKESHKGKNDKAPVRCNMWMTERGYNEDAANTYTVIRDPREHVLSQYFHCKESRHSKEDRLRRIGSLNDWLEKWVGTLEGGKVDDMNCYDPRNMQSQFTNYGSPPANDWPGNDALRDIHNRFTVIGPMDEMDRVLCVTFLHYTGWLPPQCDCTTETTTTTTTKEDDANAKMQSKESTKNSHGVKHHAKSYTTTSYQDTLIDKLTEKDVMLYEGVKHIFNEQVRVLESRLNVKICKEFRYTFDKKLFQIVV